MQFIVGFKQIKDYNTHKTAFLEKKTTFNSEVWVMHGYYAFFQTHSSTYCACNPYAAPARIMAEITSI